MFDTYWNNVEETLVNFANTWEKVAEKPEFAEAWSETASEMGRLSDPKQWTEQVLPGRRAKVGNTPYRNVWRWGSAALRYYEPEKKEKDKVVFIVYAMVNRPYVMDLLPGRSVIERFLAQGYQVYMLDWGEPTRTEGEMSMESFIEEVLGGAVDEVLEREGRSSIPILGYCQGGTYTIEYAMSHPQKVESLALMAAPVDFKKLGLLSQWSKNFHPESMLDQHGNVPGWRIRMAFESLRPFHVALRWNSFTRTLLEGKATEKKKEHFAAMERWIADAVDIPGQCFIEFVENYYWNNDLLDRLGHLKTPLLSIVGEKDHLVPPESTLALMEGASSEIKDVIRCQCGHIGLSVGSRAHREVWPQVMKWFEKQKRSKNSSSKKSAKK